MVNAVGVEAGTEFLDTMAQVDREQVLTATTTVKRVVDLVKFANFTLAMQRESAQLSFEERSGERHRVCSWKALVGRRACYRHGSSPATVHKTTRRRGMRA